MKYGKDWVCPECDRLEQMMHQTAGKKRAGVKPYFGLGQTYSQRDYDPPTPICGDSLALLGF